MDYTKTFQEKNIKVKFFENEFAGMDEEKDGETYYLTLDILVFIDHKIHSRYCRHFEKEVNPMHYNAFIKKFLEDIEYRRQFHYDRHHWEGKISYRDDNGVNRQCRELINALNRKKHTKFSDFVSLKTFGVDSFSRMSFEKLSGFVSSSDIELIKHTFRGEKIRLSALRWMARGLKPALAIRKIKTDLEVQANSNHEDFITYISEKTHWKK